MHEARQARDRGDAHRGDRSSALANAPDLDELFLYENRIAALDLAPLAGCAKLTVLDVESNAFDALDVTPILGCARLGRFVVSGDVALTATVGRPDELPPALAAIADRIAWRR